MAGMPPIWGSIDLVLGFLKQTAAANGSVLDAGCGLGHLTDAIAAAGSHAVGVDPSCHSIDYATKKFSAISFITQTLELYLSDDRNVKRFDAVVANMVMHATPQLDMFATSAARALRPGGSFVATIPHPCFFLTGKKMASAPFDYTEHYGLMIPFRINGGRTHPELVPYFHRTIETHCEAMSRAGLSDREFGSHSRLVIAGATTCWR